MEAELIFEVKSFDQLSLNQLYRILELRSEIFVVEQRCVYQDIDNQDHEALHIIGYLGEEIIAYARCFKPGIYFEEAAIGRVLIQQDYRKLGYGHQLMEASISAVYAHYQTRKIRISAQQYLMKFYRQHGFIVSGEGYLEDGIPHISMVKT